MKKTSQHYLVATIRPWHINAYRKTVRKFPGKWHLITKKDQLTPALIRKINPRYIFFPHWSYIVPEEILNIAECVCFHSTPVPYGRGGSPIQNMIAHGHKKTMITALRMSKGLDEGPVYLQKPLSLNGSAAEIFERSAKIIPLMIKQIITKEPVPKPQSGKPVCFPRRTPAQSEITPSLQSLEQVYDLIRMLDAPGYPKAFIKIGKFRFELDKAKLQKENIVANVTITL